MPIAQRQNSNYFWRIVFTIMIALLHSNYIVKNEMAWYLAVDYFFIISGYMLGSSVHRKKQSTIQYMKDRIFKLYPHQLFSFIVIFGWNCYCYGFGAMKSRIVPHLGEALPMTYFIFSDEAALGYPFNFVVWYLSVLLLCSWVIHYLLQNYEKLMKTVIIPISVILIYGYFCRECTSFNVGEKLGLFLNSYYIRGFAGMNIGVAIYYLVKKLSNYSFSNLFFVLVRAVEIVSIIGIIYITFNNSGKNDCWWVLLMSVGIFCSFIYSKENWLVSKPVRKASELMYPVYLNHIFVIQLLEQFGIKGNSIKNMVLYILVLVIYSIVTKIVVEKVTAVGGSFVKRLIVE